MAKRFTDTEIWDGVWFQNLPTKMKLAWKYLCDKCNHAGIWKLNIKLIHFQTGEDITKKDLQSYFGGKIIAIENDKLFIPSFIEFQYGVKMNDLNPSNKVHLSVIQILKNKGVYKPLEDPSQGTKDKDKDKDKAKDKDKDKEKEKEAIGILEAEFQIVYDAYPLKTGRPSSLKRYLREIKLNQVVKFKNSITKYKTVLENEKFDRRPLNFTSYIGTKSTGHPWLDYLDGDIGELNLNRKKENQIETDWG